MGRYAYRILNVFTAGGDRLSGNPLCVFEDGAGLSDDQMQALARQLNLSETTFVLPPTSPGATARVRIFTPTFEMPFAGHPTLGTAHVVRDLMHAGDRVALEMPAGIVEVTSRADCFTLRRDQAPKTRPFESTAHASAMLQLPDGAVSSPPLWVNMGAEQLVIPLATPDHVASARPDAQLLGRYAFSESRGEAMAYVWARMGEEELVARFFFLVHGGVVEDPATGSACANLGGWFIATGRALPLHERIHQGIAVGRPSLLDLRVDRDRQVFVSGDVIELGRGTMTL